MQSALVNLTYEIEVKAGEAFVLPEEIIKHLEPGKWLITIRPASKKQDGVALIRDHRAFLNSYAVEDEGLYDDYSGR